MPENGIHWCRKDAQLCHASDITEPFLVVSHVTRVISHLFHFIVILLLQQTDISKQLYWCAMIR